MINGFEDFTYELSDKEKRILPWFVNGLKVKIGKEKAVTNKEMCAGFLRLGQIVSEARARKIISHIRINGLVKNLIATSKGYYIEPDLERRRVYVESLNQRIRAIEAVRDSFEITGQTEFL